jgi:hypothetical protein
MAIVAGDWSIDRTTKKIAYIGGDHGASPTYATVIEFHRWLQDLADDAVATGNDELDITNTDPSRRSTDNIITLINGYTLEETGGTPASEHLYDGSIIEAGGDRVWDGFVNFGNASVVIQVIQDGAVLTDDWWNLAGGTGVNADAASGISHRWMMKVREDGVDIDGRRFIGTTRVMDTGAGVDHFTFSEFKINGTSNGNNVFALTNADDLNNSSTETAIASWTNITNTEGLRLIDVDADGTSEEYYSEWTDNDTPDRSQNDYYERLKWLTRDGSASTIGGMNGEAFRGITHNLAWDADAGIQPVTNDIVVWGTNVVFNGGTGTFTVGEAVHEDTATPTWKGRVIGYTGVGATGSLIVDVTSGTVTTAETFTGQSSAATATVNGTPTVVTGGGAMVCLAVDDNAGSGNLYVQLTNGTISGNNATLYNAQTNKGTLSVANTLTQNLAAVERTVSTPFVGVSTGSNIIGAYGIGFGVADLNDSDILTALDGNTYSRPNLVTNTISGLTFTGDADYVIVGPWDGSTLDVNGDPAITKTQLSLATILNTDNITQVEITESIPADTPAAGTIRVTDNNGFERRLSYSNWENGTPNRFYNITTTDGNEDFLSVNANVGNDIWISYLDLSATAGSHSFQSTYKGTDTNLVAIVRNGGASPIKQFISSWSIASAGQTLSAIRTTDL